MLATTASPTKDPTDSLLLVRRSRGSSRDFDSNHQDNTVADKNNNNNNNNKNNNNNNTTTTATTSTNHIDTDNSKIDSGPPSARQHRVGEALRRITSPRPLLNASPGQTPTMSTTSTTSTDAAPTGGNVLRPPAIHLPTPQAVEHEKKEAHKVPSSGALYDMASTLKQTSSTPPHRKKNPPPPPPNRSNFPPGWRSQAKGCIGTQSRGR